MTNTQDTVTIKLADLATMLVAAGYALQTPAIAPTVPTVAPVAPVTPVTPVTIVEPAEDPAPTFTIAPKGNGTAERKSRGGKTPPAPKATVKRPRGPRTPAQQAGIAKTRFSKHTNTNNAQIWHDLCVATGDADRVKLCVGTLKTAGMRVAKGTVKN